MATDPAQGASGLNATTRAALEKLRGQIDSNQNGLKGSELINFQQFAQANGIKEEDIQAFMEENGLAVSKSAKDIRKEDIADFKDDQYSRTSRGTKNEIIDQRQGYMQVALDALQKAKTPEEKARIMNLVQSMPRSAASVDSFDTKMRVWLGSLENIVGQEQLQQSMAAFSKKTSAGFKAMGKTLEESETAIKGAISEATDKVNEHTDESAAAINKHTSAEAGATRKHVSRVGNNVVRRVNEHTSAEAAATREHVTAEVDRGVGEVKEHVTQEVDRGVKAVNEHTSKEVARGVDAVKADATTRQTLDSARQEITEILQECNLDDDDVRALTNEATDIMNASKLTQDQKYILLQSMAQKINDVAYISDRDLAKIRHARALMENGQGNQIPTKSSDLNGIVKDYIDYDNLPDLQ